MKLEAGMRCKVFDPSLYKDDNTTPTTVTIKPATVLRRYIFKSVLGHEDEVVDVRFDHDGRESKAHFTWAVKESIE